MKTQSQNLTALDIHDIARPNSPILQEARPNSATGTGRPNLPTEGSTQITSPAAKKKFYPGNKGADGTYQRIINQMPPHSVYIELFTGSGQILIKKKPAARNIAIEISSATISNHSCRWASSTEVICTDAIQWLRDNLAQFGPETLIYADPPYPRASRKSPKKLYQFEMDQDQHTQLLELLKQSRAMVMLSSYPNELYTQHLGTTHRMEQFTVATRGGNALEVLWMNYPTPTELHQYDFLGTDKEERRRIKRKAKRWQNGLLRLPPLERNAIINGILNQPNP